MGILDNIQSGLEAGIRGFGQTFVPMYQKSIETPIKIKLENYLMKKQLEAQTEAWKDREEYKITQKVKQKTAETLAYNYTALTNASNVIDKIRDSQIKKIIKSYDKNINVENIDINDLINEKKINSEIKTKILDVMRSAEERKAALVSKQKERIQTKIKEIKDPIEQAGLLSADDELLKMYSGIQNRIEQISNNKISSISSGITQPSEILKSESALQKFETQKTVGAIEEKKLKSLETSTNPDVAKTNFETLVSSNSILNKTTLPSKVNEIYSNDTLSETDKTEAINFATKVASTIIGFNNSEKLRNKMSSGSFKSISSLLSDATDYTYNTNVKKSVGKLQEAIQKQDANGIIKYQTELKKSMKRANSDFTKGKNTFNLYSKQLKSKITNDNELISESIKTDYNDFETLANELSSQLSLGNFSMTTFRKLNNKVNEMLVNKDIKQYKGIYNIIKSFKRNLPIILRNITGGKNINIKTEVTSTPKQLEQNQPTKNEKIFVDTTSDISSYSIENILDKSNR